MNLNWMWTGFKVYHCQVLDQDIDFNLKPGVSGVSYRDNINK